jgi:hypothetical protein
VGGMEVKGEEWREGIIGGHALILAAGAFVACFLSLHIPRCHRCFSLRFLNPPSGRMCFYPRFLKPFILAAYAFALFTSYPIGHMCYVIHRCYLCSRC